MNNFETIYTESSSYLSSHNHDGLYFTKSEMESQFYYSGNDGSGSGSDADLIYRSSGNLHVGSFSGIGVPTGLIIMWAGETAPSGWHLCDGTGGTVNLTWKFVLGAGSTYSVGNTGTGAHTPTGTITVAGHSLSAAEVAGHQHSYTDYYHDVAAGVSYYPTYVTATYITGYSNTSRSTGNSNIGKATADAHSHTGSFTGTEFNVLPTWYALAFIQKM